LRREDIWKKQETKKESSPYIYLLT
jgi:hypothetical protein